MNYPNAAKGLKMMFWAAIASIIAAVFSAIPVIGIIGQLATIACSVISILGVYTAGKDDEGYKKAFIFTILSFAAAVVAAIISGLLGAIPILGPIITKIVQIVCTIFELLITYYVIITSVNILRTIGANEIADKGMNVWQMVMLCTIAGIILGLLAVIPIIDFIAAFLLVIVAIVELVANILYLMFLYKSYKALGA